MTAQKATASAPAPGIPYYTPAQTPPAGSALPSDGPVPTLFKPLTIRGTTLANRFLVSPMCMYSADEGHLTDFHLVHLGAFALRGAALTMVEATAVTANGRISPEDSGLWLDSQIAPLKRIVDFVHSQGHKTGIQIGHAGRKASTVALWHGIRGQRQLAGPELGGWPDDVWAPSALPYADTFPQPQEMTVAEIEGLVKSFVDAAVRAVRAGFDVIEIHAAHGYLIMQFLSPLSNKRTDRYGGSFENRARLLVEIIQAVRGVMPEAMPLFVRISATEWMEWSGQDSWDVEQSVRLALLLPDLGVDLLDISSSGNSAAQKIDVKPNYQADLAGRIRAALRADGKDMLIGAVGMITNGEMARSIVQEDDVGGKLANGESRHAKEEEETRGTVEVKGEHGQVTQADVVSMARQFLREPEFVLRTAHQLGVKVAWPAQYLVAGWPKDAKI